MNSDTYTDPGPGHLALVRQADAYIAAQCDLPPPADSSPGSYPHSDQLVAGLWFDARTGRLGVAADIQRHCQWLLSMPDTHLLRSRAMVDGYCSGWALADTGDVQRPNDSLAARLAAHVPHYRPAMGNYPAGIDVGVGKLTAECVRAYHQGLRLGAAMPGVLLPSSLWAMYTATLQPAYCARLLGVRPIDPHTLPGGLTPDSGHTGQLAAAWGVLADMGLLCQVQLLQYYADQPPMYVWSACPVDIAQAHAISMANYLRCLAHGTSQGQPLADSPGMVADTWVVERSRLQYRPALTQADWQQKILPPGLQLRVVQAAG